MLFTAAPNALPNTAGPDITAKSVKKTTTTTTTGPVITAKTAKSINTAVPNASSDTAHPEINAKSVKKTTTTTGPVITAKNCNIDYSCCFKCFIR
jgi:hypothetical protein